ncbi:MAG: DUF1002 domain-containing protein [Lachnospiraceae bacterium]|nr:DUF1002 domain-containing protein [Lachnospiraceae bacterium]
MKRILACILAGILCVMPASAVSAKDVQNITWGDGTEAADNSGDSTESAETGDTVDKSQIYLAVGADLTSSQLATVMSLMGLSGTDISGYNVVNVTNSEEHQYLDSYISSSVIGTKSLSSVLVKPAESGHGINVVTHNINYCTEGMYQNALITAGVEDADIIVAAPTSISGTAALIGALKAYAQMTDTSLDTQALDTSLDELVTTGELEEAAAAANGASSEEVEALLSFIKQEIAKRDLSSKEAIEEAVRAAIADYNSGKSTKIELSDDEISKIVSLMEKINDLGLDYDTLIDQAASIYQELGDNITGDDLANALEKNKSAIAGSVVKSFFKGVGDKIVSFFKNLFG